MGAMNTEDVKLYLQNIEEYVIDEDKIVTYKWLSKNLDVHVNTAKQLLHSFAVDHKDDIYLTYLIGGIKFDGSGCKIQIVPEEGLEEVKKSFKVVTSEHVYSVQKAKMLPDLSLIYGVDSCKGNDSKRLGAVQYNRSVTRCQEEIERLRLTALSVASHADGNCRLASKSTDTTKSKPVETSVSKKDVLPEDSKDGNGAVKNKGIAAMFAAQGKKSKDNETIEKKTTAEGSLPKQKTGSGITMFFNRQIEKQQLQNVKPESAKTVTSSRDPSETKTHETKDGEKKDKSGKINSSVKAASIKEPTYKKESITSSKKHEKNGRRLKNKKFGFEDDPVPSKKRKRIVVMSDSEDSSDDIFDKKDTDEESCPSPSVAIKQTGSDSEAAVGQPDSEPEAGIEQPGSESDVVPPTPEGKPKRGRKRVRRLVDKTYMDDGYLLTKKEYVFESCTDSEGEEKTKNGKNLPEEMKELKKTEESKIIKTNKNEPPAKKKASPQKTKQSTLMNFFKKST